MVGHATGVGHYSAGMDYTTSGLRERGVAMGMGVGGSIAEGEEGEEEEEGDAVGLNITGYSGFLRKLFMLTHNALLFMYSICLCVYCMHILYKYTIVSSMCIGKPL